MGTIYKRESPFLAKKVGASLVAKNLSKIIDAHFAHREKDTKVLVYCWRGGERSLSLAHVLSRIGFTVGIVPGGYKRYRAGVLEFLRSMDGFRYHLVAGKTGVREGEDARDARGAGRAGVGLGGHGAAPRERSGRRPGDEIFAAVAEGVRHEAVGEGEDV